MDEREPAPSGASKCLHVGLDVGSTTVKLAALRPDAGEVLSRMYRRHHARQADEAASLIRELSERFPGSPLKLSVTGSGGAPLAAAIGAPFVQEAVANAAAVQRLYPQARTAIELGGQDAKIVFFEHDERTGQPEVSDMRMNGSCAGGTGAFLDEIATLLSIPVESFDELASKGDAVHSVSGRCGVFAKTDIQPLAAAGVPKEDLALSALHAVAKQTIGGLAQGRDIEAPVIFEGGPLMFNPTLVRVFAERLELKSQEVIVPDHPETIVALGAALLLSDSLGAQARALSAQSVLELLANASGGSEVSSLPPLFADDAARKSFERRHCRCNPPSGPRAGKVRAYLGIDSGSTTMKMALIGEDGSLIDSRYASSEGDPLSVARNEMIGLRRSWEEAGGELEIAALGVTGYGEGLLAEAYGADVGVVETVAHARAAIACNPGATFVLDIGGQDMKALWIDDGVITDIVVNEACSSGCGSFLEGFAASLGIERSRMAEAAFASESPAALGSRCTVFMNSGIITAQRAGKSPEDIMAGLALSVVENVFTKVIRASNLDALGECVVVQGGTFANDAVLRAFELYLGREVTRTPYPELAGAIGAALSARDAAAGGGDGAGGGAAGGGGDSGCAGGDMLDAGGDAVGAEIPSCASCDSFQTSFIGIDAACVLEAQREANVVCELCANRCSRTAVRFSSGKAFVTGNRCSRGEALDLDEGDASAAPVEPSEGAAPIRSTKHRKRGVDLFKERERLLFKRYEAAPLLPARDVTIGLPRVLGIWENAPFWNALFRSLGFNVEFSAASTREMYERSLGSVASDTACFPAKLAHGHVRDLAQRGVNRIFMPVITTVEPEGTSPSSESMCALVKGYPLVIRSSDCPEETWGVRFDSPLFHWPTSSDRNRQLSDYLHREFGIAHECARKAISVGDAAQRQFKSALEERGAKAIERAHGSGSFAVVLASRPYQNDPLVCHGIPELFADRGIDVIPVDALPGLSQVRLDASRVDVVNNFHARMLAGALYAASADCLEYAQIVSFGCGHDAYLTDEIARLMRGVSDKAPLVLKVDEGDVSGPLGIRVRSFVETVHARRRRLARSASQDDGGGHAGWAEAPSLPDPYPVKFYREDAAERTVLVPNASHAFSRLMAAVFSRQGLRAVSLELGGEEAIRLGKKYIHNDICFPAQMVIGEALAALESGDYDPDCTAIGMAKYIGDCRLTHYSALLRKALDDAGYSQVPIITNDGNDERGLHPGFRMTLASAANVALCLPMVDALEELLRKMRPYELEAGSAQAAFDAALDCVIEGVAQGGAVGARRGFKRAIRLMREVRYDRSHARPRVLVVGEYLLNFHPGANRHIERYLEDSGMEVVEARMTDVIRKTYFYQRAQVREYGIERELGDKAFLLVADRLFEMAHDITDGVARAHPLYEPPTRMPELVRASDPIIHHTFDAGEGVLIPAEVLHHYSRGVRSFVILQPFGCLPNHIVGRGIIKSLRRACPDAQLLPLDYDPDVSPANIENRLQMLVMRALRNEG